jgi:hypothetical protein
MPQRSVLRGVLFLAAAMTMLTNTTAQQPPPGDQEQCRPAVFCAKGSGPDAREVCFTDKTHVVCASPGSEEEQREMREILKLRAEELRRRLQQQTDQLRKQEDR